MEIPLHSEIERIVNRHMQSGKYSSAAEVVRRAVLLLDQKEPLVRDGRRSPRGLLADIPSHLNADDFTQMREELWAGFSRHGA